MTASPFIAHRLDAAGLTLVVAGPAGRVPGIAYWGPALPPDEDIAALAAASAFPVGHAGLDVPYAASLFPEAAHGHFGTPALEAFSIGDDGSARRWTTRFAPTAVEVADGALIVEAADGVAALSLRITLSLASGTGVLAARTRLANDGDRPLAVGWLAAPALPVPRDDAELLSWHGRWCSEVNRTAEPWPRGARVLESRLGRTGHETFPGFVSLGPGAGETAGRATAAHFGWSGNWRMIAEDVSPGLRHILAGVLHLPGEAILAPGEALETPPLYAARSEAGLNGASQAFHAEARRLLVHPRPAAPRPVHFNSWEAVYFDLDVDTLKDLASRAAAVGAERFVVDDGWFPARADDRAGLGDWWVDPAKFPDGLHPLIAHVHALGMSFGLWVEPEMVNPDSDLFRAHPDWALRLDGYEQLLGRHQLVLDIANPAVSDYLFDKLSALLSEYPIGYFKWDMNRVLTLAGRDGRPVAAEQPAALYALLQRLRAAHPGTEIESCSSGGGRIDFGILPHVQRFWLSDNNDAHDRWRMNREASVFFPPEVFGHHVGPSPCHTSGRRLSMAFRAYTAAFGGHMGLELDLRALAADEEAVLRDAIAFHKRWRSVLHAGRLERLVLEPGYLGSIVHAPDGSSFIAAIAQRETLTRSSGALVSLTGLDPLARYHVRFAEGAPLPTSGGRSFPSPLADPAGLTASGRALATSGFRLPTGWPDQLWLVEGHRTEGP